MKSRAALIYATKLKWRVVPLHDVSSGACSCGNRDPKHVRQAGKHPRHDGWQREAGTPEQIAAWWEANPTANVGISTGAGSGFFAFDVDPDNGGDRTLAALVAIHGPLPLTASARTGSGGTHYLFQHVEGLSNSAGKLGLGLDIRGEGGQIVVSPSASLKGSYSWIVKPWITPPAPAPAWLIEALRRPAVTVAPGQISTERGYFPAAPQAVLDAAAAALERHGPAREGHGGDAHTFRAGAIVTHDFALTEDEAWPLLCDWNDTCSPPWGEDDLAAKMRGGLAYATGAFGSRRSMDARATAAKVVIDWQATPGDPMVLVRRVRELAATLNDPAERALMERDAHQATGLPPKALALPHGPGADLPENAIVVTTEIHTVADKAIAALAPVIFARNGVLCEVVKAERTFISDLETARVQDLMSQTAPYFRMDEKSGAQRCAAPLTIAQLLHSRRTHPPAIRVLEAITTAPVFLADGTILSQRGYNAAARVFLEPSVSVTVPEQPTQEDAAAAVDTFRGIMSGFDFATGANGPDFSSWLAALLSPLVKAATENAPSPLFCISASNAGSGKTLLADVIAQVVTGDAKIENSPYNPRDPGEWGKRLTAFVKAAAPVRAFDNINGAIGDENLDRLLTAAIWSDRILGASEAPPLPIVTTWLATGNNIEPVGDTVRRVLVIRIEVDTEQPQERTGFAFDLEGGYAREHRSELLSAALTILRAYHCAGRPAQKLPSWGSFTAWSSLVRGALVWSGCADPFLTQARATADLNEPDNDQHDFWIGTIDATDGSPAAIVAEAGRRNACEVLGLREQVSVYGLRKFVGRYVDKPRAGKRIRRDSGRGYHVEVIRA